MEIELACDRLGSRLVRIGAAVLTYKRRCSSYSIRSSAKEQVPGR